MKAFFALAIVALVVLVVHFRNADSGHKKQPLVKKAAPSKVVALPIYANGGVKAPDKLAPSGAGYVSNDPSCRPPDCEEWVPTKAQDDYIDAYLREYGRLPDIIPLP